MTDYPLAIEQHIEGLLSARGSVTIYQLPGTPEDEAVDLLRRYASLHPQIRCEFDGRTLRCPHKGAEPGETAMSPVDVVLAMPPRKALLDSAPSGGRVAKLVLFLPIVFGLVGGLIAWLMLRNDNPRAGRNLLVLGAVVQVVSIITAWAMASGLAELRPGF